MSNKLYENKRPSWDEIFMDVAETMSKRSTCLRRQVGAVLVKNNEIISTGYNGAPKGVCHCTDIGVCLREKLNIPSGERAELCRATHAEQNAIIQCATKNSSTLGATIYVTAFPCSMCMKILINAGIKRIVSKSSYPDELSLELLKETDIEFEVWED